MSATAAAPTAPTSFQHLKGRQLTIALTGVMLGLLLSSLDQTIVGTAMPRIIADLGGLDHYAWVATAYLLTSTASVPIFGKLSDIYGRKWFYIGGMVLFMIGSALCGLSQSMFQLIAFRGLQGIAGGVLTANTFAIIGDLFPPAERGKWQGLTGSVFGLASVVGPTLGGWLTDGPGWRWVFYVNLPVGIVAIAVLLVGLPAIRPHERRPIDWLGAGAIVGGTVPLLLAFSWAGTDYPWGSPQILSLLAFSAVMIVAFIFIESRAAEPIIPLRFFRNRIFAVSVTVMFLVGSAMFGAILYVPLFVQGVIGQSATNSGAVLTPMMLALVIASTTSGQVISRSGRYKWSALLGLSIVTFGLWLQSRMDVNTSSGTAVRNMIVLGLGIGLSMPTFTIAVQNAFPAKEIGVVTAAVQFFRSIGATIGVAIMGTFLTTSLHDNLTAGLPPDVRQAIPAGTIGAIDPQALASPDAQRALQAQFAAVPDGGRLFAELMATMRAALATALHDAFLMSALVAACALATSLLLREIPLRKRQATPAIEEAGKELAITGAAEVAVLPAGSEPRLSVAQPMRQPSGD
ncbi:MAG TPA: MDR family MFS transporter [Thermomicrobiales bacterium]